MSSTDRPSPSKASSTPPSPRFQLLSGLPVWLRWPATGLLALVGLACAAAASGAILAVIALSVAYPNLPEIKGLIDYRPKLPMRVFSADEVLIGEFGEERRQFTPIA